ncbi:hypothetical protein SADUNF_Sadunf06G0103600 [Salix dunnii]|uniref:Uncharacterized protein n=1 Tax=Salix dunnii TaxID=1413687 RepID=A0A835K1S7_9ROSI|nr:hypothetical protein SADUNF_Sadunf06G0103600 [Salix dunnii]
MNMISIELFHSRECKKDRKRILQLERELVGSVEVDQGSLVGSRLVIILVSDLIGLLQSPAQGSRGSIFGSIRVEVKQPEFHSIMGLLPYLFNPNL